MAGIINIERASESTIMALMNLGIIYVGEDNQLHVIDAGGKADE